MFQLFASISMLFQYAQLAQDSIRLVEFHPSSTPSDIHLTLSHQSKYFDGAAHYSAIWYEAGDANSARKTVTLNGRTRTVPSTAWDALSTIVEHHGNDNKYWIDAVCINQQDEAEKNSHRRQFSRIFSSAEKVFVWLGRENADESTKRAFSAVQNGAEPDSDQKAALQCLAKRDVFVKASSSPELRHENAILLSDKLECPMNAFERHLKSLGSFSEGSSGSGRQSNGAL